MLMEPAYQHGIVLPHDDTRRGPLAHQEARDPLINDETHTYSADQEERPDLEPGTRHADHRQRSRRHFRSALWMSAELAHHLPIARTSTWWTSVASRHAGRQPGSITAARATLDTSSPTKPSRR